MYVTHRSSAAPAPAIRDFFWLYHTYSLLRGGFYNASSGFGPTLRGQLNTKCFHRISALIQLYLVKIVLVKTQPRSVCVVFDEGNCLRSPTFDGLVSMLCLLRWYRAFFLLFVYLNIANLFRVSIWLVIPAREFVYFVPSCSLLGFLFLKAFNCSSSN